MIIVGLEKKIEKQLLLIWKKFSAAFPVICFFLCLFFGVVNIFGSQYVMIVSLVTVLFQVNHKKRNTLKSLLGVSALQLMLCFLAYIATLSFPLSMFLNLTVPFALIFLKASQFNQMGYFSGLMTFTFLQLMPVDFSGFLVQMAAMLSGLSSPDRKMAEKPGGKSKYTNRRSGKERSGRKAGGAAPQFGTEAVH